jgi:CubicO group peptidase (beta-lactamase class C family)
MANLPAGLSKIMLILFLCFSLCFSLPENQASAEDETKTKIEDYVKDYLEEYQVKGASDAIVHHNELFFSKSWGVTGESEE